ncbi:uncharacterized protein LOC135924486 [Gordionus sp. m RMFG-2023]|uniref:uncharacterized protein LOC135924486 n=1 Tax=Gordionus sp. m RMFG-2023 TaxID=3053472 RepID=UPI0031FBD9A5
MTILCSKLKIKCEELKTNYNPTKKCHFVLFRNATWPFIYLIKPYNKLQENLNERIQTVKILSEGKIQVLNVNDMICNGTTVLASEKMELCKIGTIVLKDHMEYQIIKNDENIWENFVFHYSKN